MILLQLIANGLLLWLAYYWLGIGEATAGQVIWSGAVGLAIVCGACWLHGAAFAYFGPANRQLRIASAKSLRYLFPLLIAAGVLAGVYVLLGRCGEWSARPAFRIASYLTMKLRTPVKPSAILRWFQVGLWLLRWIAVPVLALPMIAGIAFRGWAGFRHLEMRAGNWRYWIETPVLALAAFWLPFQIFAWTPRGSFALEMASFVVRFAAGYLLFLSAWLSLVFVTSGGIPRFNHSKTAPSP